MSFSILTGHRHGDRSHIVVAGPGDNRELSDRFKRLTVDPGDLADIQLICSNGGLLKRKNFPPPKEKAPAKPEGELTGKETDSQSATPDQPLPPESPAKAAALLYTHTPPSKSTASVGQGSEVAVTSSAAKDKPSKPAAAEPPAAAEDDDGPKLPFPPK